MLKYAPNRVTDAEFLRIDLGIELPFDGDSFDGVASSLAFHYVPDWKRLFRNLRRVIESGGWVVFSVQHPHADFEEYDDAQNYHETELVSAMWESFEAGVAVPTFRRPFSAMITPALENGFRLEQLLEPTPTAEYRRAAPKRYEYEATHPSVLCFRFVLAENSS